MNQAYIRDFDTPYQKLVKLNDTLFSQKAQADHELRVALNVLRIQKAALEDIIFKATSYRNKENGTEFDALATRARQSLEQTEELCALYLVQLTSSGIPK